MQHVRLPYAAAHSCPNYRTDREADCFTDSGLRDFGLERIFGVHAAVRRRLDGAKPQYHARGEWRNLCGE